MNRSFLFAGYCVLAAALAPTISHAAPIDAAPLANSTSAKPVKLFAASAISLRTLPNGVRGVVRETRGTALVAVQVWVRAGSRYESDAENGASRLIESLALRASQSFPRGAADLTGGAGDALEFLGAQVSSQVSRDATFYGATIEARLLPQTLSALADAVLRPHLTDSAVEGAKIEVQNELLNRESDPLQAAADISYRAAFARHPYRKPPGGTSIGVESMKPSRVRAYHAARYVGDNISVVIVGDTQGLQAHKLIAKYFGAAPLDKTKPVSVRAETAPAAFKSVARKRPINRTAVALAFGSPGIKTPADVVAMDVLLAHWREGSGAVLRNALLGPEPDPNGADAPADAPAAPTNSDAPALAFDVDYLTQRDPGLFVISLVVEPANRDAAIAATLKEVETVQRDAIGADALMRAKRVLSQQYTMQGETVSGQAGALGFYEMIDSYRFAVDYLDRIQRVTADDVRRVAQKYLSRTRYIQTSIEPTPRERNPNQRPNPGRGTVTASWQSAANDSSANDSSATRN